MNYFKFYPSDGSEVISSSQEDDLKSFMKSNNLSGHLVSSSSFVDTEKQMIYEGDLVHVKSGAVKGLNILKVVKNLEGYFLGLGPGFVFIPLSLINSDDIFVLGSSFRITERQAYQNMLERVYLGIEDAER